MYKLSAYNFTGRCNGSLYLANTVSGAVARIDAGMLDLLRDERFPDADLPEATVSSMAAQGFLVPAEKDEYQALLEQETRRLYADPETLSFVIATTLACNYRCPYCYQPKAEAPAMNDKTAAEVLALIRSRITPVTRTLKITWFGGEPLLNQEILFSLSRQLIELAEARGLRYEASIITNGYLLDAPTAERLYTDARISAAQITLDGLGADYERAKVTPPGAFLKVITNIRTASQLFRVFVRLNLPPCSCPELKAIIDTLSGIFRPTQNVRLYLAEVCADWKPGREADAVSFTDFETRLQFFEDYLQKNEPRLFTRRTRIAYCGGSCGLICKQNAVIGPCGELYRCEHMIGRPGEVIGSCAEGLYHNSADTKFSHPTHPEKCRSCVAFPLCMSGCPNDILEHKTDRIHCMLHRERLLQALLQHADEAAHKAC